MRNFRTATAATLWATLCAMPATGQDSLASTMGVYVFPTGELAEGQQAADEASCYQWATENTGSDPFQLEKDADDAARQAGADMQAAEQAGRGSGLRGAARGAAAGAIIGEIADDDASKGAAYGAAAGAIRGRRQGNKAEANAQQQVAAGAEQSAAANGTAVENFKKAFSVCLEAKEYMVKY